jgi:putative transcriptional regulator
MKTRKTVGARIITGLEEALAYERGALPDARVTRIPLTARSAHVRPAPGYDATRIAALRARLRLSQPIFARALNVSPDTVRAWEQGKRRPDGAALRLLQVAERHPHVIVEHVRQRSA